MPDLSTSRIAQTARWCRQMIRAARILGLRRRPDPARLLAQPQARTDLLAALVRTWARFPLECLTESEDRFLRETLAGQILPPLDWPPVRALTVTPPPCSLCAPAGRPPCPRRAC